MKALNAMGVFRDVENTKSLEVVFNRRPTDDEMRAVHRALREPVITSTDLEAFGNAVCGMLLDVERSRIDAEERRICSFCTALVPVETIRSHMSTCERHPMRAVEQQRDELLAVAQHVRDALDEGEDIDLARVLAAIAKAEGGGR